jgi:hypothetical protein
MMVFSFEAPRDGDRAGVVVVLVLEPENLERMKLGDPFDLQFKAYEQHWPVGRPLRDVDFIVAYEEDVTAIKAFNERADLAGLMDYLERGRHHLPGYGDAQPPRKLPR